MAERALDLFKFLAALNARDSSAYEKLSEDEKKEAHPLIIMRWLSGTSNPGQIVALNSFVNKYVFSLADEKELLFKLMALSCSGSSRASWIKGPGNSKHSLSISVLMQMYECSQREAKEYLPVLDKNKAVKFAENLGWDKAEIKKLEAEFK